ncbi:hypothetical protein JCM8547_007050 [Rhodosporidiobolus lusitaniae]
MGNDGGSIPKRHELIKTKQTRARDDESETVRQRWAFCALSKQPLRQPVVSCPLGRLYNKEALISYLLNPPSSSEHSPFGSDGLLVAGHIRSLKDVTTLRLTPNPSLPTDGDESSKNVAVSASHVGTTPWQDKPAAQFVCPISMREMNGSVRFVYRKPCGCVMSEASLKEMRKGVEKKGEQAKEEEKQGGELSSEVVCPVDGETSTMPEEWVTLNPKEDELERMKEAWEAKKQKEKEDKKKAKAAKRKSGADGAAADGEDAPAKPKKKKTDAAALKAAAPAVKAGSTVVGLQATLAAKLAEEKKKHSPAIASLYAQKTDDEMKDKDGRSNWMTIGAYSRF